MCYISIKARGIATYGIYFVSVVWVHFIFLTLWCLKARTMPLLCIVHFIFQALFGS